MSEGDKDGSVSELWERTFSLVDIERLREGRTYSEVSFRTFAITSLELCSRGEWQSSGRQLRLSEEAMG